MRRGSRYYRNGLYREALGYFEEGRGKNEKSVVPHFNSGAALYKMEDFVRSVGSFTQALKHADKDDEIANIHYNLGNNHFQIGNYEKAVEYYVQALEKNPNDLNAKFNLELALEKLAGGTAPDQEEVQDEQGKDGEQTARGDVGDEGEKEGSEGDQEPGEREFSQEDARRLVDSVNNDQSRILNEIIQNRAGSVQYERDW
jgi:tetratricopeptide (TPR) repeat protein